MIRLLHNDSTGEVEREEEEEVGRGGGGEIEEAEMRLTAEGNRVK
jgi:hypothetical protein